MNRLYQIIWIVLCVLLWLLPLNAEGLAVQITGPADGTSYNTGATVNIEISLSVTSGTIESAELYQNGWLVSDLDAASPNYTWNNIPAGNYQLTVKAVDDEDNEVTSDPVTIHVGGILKYDRAINGEFIANESVTPWRWDSPWPWRFDTYENAEATIELDNVGLSDDTSSAYITFQDIEGRPEWCVQLMQQFRLQEGHKYEIYFSAWALAEKPIQVTFSRDYGDFGTYWYTDITLSDEPQEYGPYTYESTVDDSLIMMKFVLSIGLNTTELYIDNVRILDIHPSTPVEEDITSRPPGKFRLMQNYPNPFNPSTTIPFELAEAGSVELVVYNMLGEKIAVLASGMHNAGSYTVHWNAENFPTGIYFYKLTTDHGTSETKKLVLLK